MEIAEPVKLNSDSFKMVIIVNQTFLAKETASF